MADVQEKLEYVGFWARVGATIIDSILILIIIFPILTAFYGTAYWESENIVEGPMDFLLTYIFPMVAIIAF